MILDRFSTSSSRWATLNFEFVLATSSTLAFSPLPTPSQIKILMTFPWQSTKKVPWGLPFHSTPHFLFFFVLLPTSWLNAKHVLFNCLPWLIKLLFYKRTEKIPLSLPSDEFSVFLLCTARPRNFLSLWKINELKMKLSFLCVLFGRWGWRWKLSCWALSLGGWLVMK